MKLTTASFSSISESLTQQIPPMDGSELQDTPVWSSTKQIIAASAALGIDVLAKPDDSV